MEAAERLSSPRIEPPSPLPPPTGTASTRSDATIRGGGASLTPYGAPMTPSYPFPRMDLGSASPLGTPGSQAQFKPFTALSPTVEPPLVKLAKAKMAHDFKASGHMKLALDGASGAAFGVIPPAPPDGLKLAVDLQMEPGLQGWWKGVCKIARESFGAERATLAVPSDITDIENVPWAQLGTFRAGEDDILSKMTNDRTSDRSNLTDLSLMDRSMQQERGVQTTPKQGTPSSTTPTYQAPVARNAAVSILASRPKLESRHSYAGYPPKEDSSVQEQAFGMRQSLKRPRVSRSSSSAAAVEQQPRVIELNEETLERHDQAYPAPLIDDKGPFNGSQGRILDVVQPLESEADALIDGSGVFRVIHRRSPILLTRQYRELADERKHDRNMANETSLKKTAAGKPSQHLPKTPASRSAAATRSKNFKVKSGLRTLEESPEKHTQEIPYEDFEQVPASPWSQSPAPSPAARNESDENPFFPAAGTVDESAFDEVLAASNDREQTGNENIPAIGLDKAATIIQIPLLHPGSRVSQAARSRREEIRRDISSAQSDRRPARSTSASTTSRYHDESTTGSADLLKEVPVAIVSLLVPVVPYPIYLTNSLIQIAPLMATSFVAARSYTNMANQIASMSKKRRFTSGLVSELSFKTESSDTSRILNDLNMEDSVVFQRALSPTSPNSLTSDHSRDLGSPSEVPIEERRPPQTPGLIAADPRGTPGQRTPRDPSSAMEMNESYFIIDEIRQKVIPEEPTPKADVSQVLTGNRPATRNPLKRADDGHKSRLHSQGASFAATHPALPTATATMPTTAKPSAETPKAANIPGTVQAHATLKPSHSMLQTMIDNGATQQWIASGSDGVIVWANAKFLVYRQSKGEDLDTDFWESVLPKERQPLRTKWVKALQTGDQFAYSCRLKRFNGQYRWFHIRIIPIRDRQGGTKFYHGQAMDIHERHEAEQSALKAKMYRSSEAKYRALANSLPVIVFAAHIPTGITFANNQWLSFSGQSLEESMGFGFLDHVHPDDLRKCRFPGFDGNPFSVPPAGSASRSPLVRQDSGASTTSSAADSDGTTATETTTKPRLSVDGPDILEPHIPTELLRQLAEDGIVMCERDGQGNLSISTELRLKSRSGEYRWHVVSGSYMESVNFGTGEAQWFIACTDITNQKLTESRMQDAKIALENANTNLALEVKSKMSYLSSMSHEIRTPLNGIIGNLQFLINSGLAEDAYEWAHGAKDAATHMSELINDILDLSKAEANMLHLSSHSFSPREITENVLDQLNSKVTEKKLELSMEFDDRVPLVLRGDSGRIRQVLLNLVSNAVKFTHQGEIWIACDLLTIPPYDLPPLGDNERFVKWTVNDTGKGFSVKDKQFLFKEYSQIKKRSDRDIGGTGLGLILCRTMVELHGGRIDASSQPGKGACFEFFARFKLRREKKERVVQASQPPAIAPTPVDMPVSSPVKLASHSALRSVIADPITPPGSTALGGSGSHTTIKQIIPVAASLPISSSLTSPAVSSTGSSILSGSSTHFARSLRSSSSTSTNEVRAQVMKLTLPDKDPDNFHATAANFLSDASLLAASEGVTPNIDGVAFRPPMFSVLLYCPVEQARRITAAKIQSVVPRSVPCQLTSEANPGAALELLSGAEAVTFTHVVVRTTSDEEALSFIDRVVRSQEHIHTALVLVTSQTQLKAFKELRPDVNLKEAQRSHGLLIIQRPCHAYKLGKIFDPFKENEMNVEDPQAAKRREEKRLQKESYALFKNVLGSRNLRVLAVEDNRMQMNVLTSFLKKMIGLEVVCAWNGQECLDLLYSHPPLYYSVIVSDIEMPLVGGYEMVRKIREWEGQNGFPHVPTVSLSANTVREGWVASADAGFTHYCPKPVNFRALGHVLLEVTDPARPHIFLKDRPLPKELSGGKVDSSDESDED